ncbi:MULTISPECIES: type IV pilus modification protein PilV [unclassified Marinobacter]|uniref:type IV pilus modification protein PilV n=1 Tax=unclassified Marinobacter TaxID=83889 RepID=UPI0012A8472E|nr:MULTISPECIES: type IV pilus modification protein PilV [unclassified Marinobacter]QFS85892.1 hypothetical protein FIV08_03465 [Marinobacter sp. THAF197a]QFT49686.1 hypothetical protein FIU96_03460 [Marinobacter sp. THAF39]
MSDNIMFQASGYHQGSRPMMQKGFSLIEVLITVLILAIGLLGLASLQANSLVGNQQSYMRSQATSLAYDMTDRLRANKRAALDGDYNSSFGDAVTCGVPQGGGTVAEDDLESWQIALACALTEGRGAVNVDGGSGIATIRVRWTNGRSGGTDTETFVTRTAL